MCEGPLREGAYSCIAMSRRTHASLRREVAPKATEGVACTKELSRPYIKRTFLCRAGSSTRCAGAPSRREPILASPHPCLLSAHKAPPCKEMAPKATEGETLFRKACGFANIAKACPYSV